MENIEFKTTVLRLCKNILEKANKFHETQLKIKHKLTKLENIVKRSNSRMEEHKNQVKEPKTLLWRNKKKRESRKLKIV